MNKSSVKIVEDKQEFKVYWELPDGVNLEDKDYIDPDQERTLKEIGIMNITNSFDIEIDGCIVNVKRNDELLEQLVPDQRQVIISHLAHILHKYLFQDINELEANKENIEKEFQQHIENLADLEEEPGVFM